MRLSAIKQASSDVVEITTEDGPVFFIRLSFLSHIAPVDIIEGAEFYDEKEEDVIDAGLAFAAEKKAEDYLARSEQCRAGLEKKLYNKGHSKKAVKIALDYLENRKLLDDVRFSYSWIRNHVISKPQGRLRLLAELCSRGIKNCDAKNALDEFFSTVDERELCQKALKKTEKSGKFGEKLLKFMIDSGFSYKMVMEEIKGRFDSCGDLHTSTLSV